MTRRFLTLGVLFSLAIAFHSSLRAQAAMAAGKTLFSLDPTGTPVGSLPAGIEVLKGDLTVALKDGVPMLRAPSESEFLVSLDAALPPAFTVEFDIVPKTCCNPEDLSFEGTREKNRGTASAHVVWHREILSVVGGGEYFQLTMPEEVKAATAGTLTRVLVTFDGGTVKLYTNGLLLYTLTSRKFLRGRVLRVFLGGYDGEPVYLARMRLAEGTAALVNTAPSPSQAGTGSGTPASVMVMQPTTVTGTITPVAASTTTAAAADTARAAGGTPASTRAPGPATTQAAGDLSFILLRWSDVPNATGYTVYRKELGSLQAPEKPRYFVQAPGVDEGMRSGVDPQVIGGVTYAYWLDATFADGTRSATSPVASAALKAPNFTLTLPGPANLKVVVGGPEPQPSLNGASGSVVTWTWDAAPMQFGYGVAADIVLGVALSQTLVRSYVATPPLDWATGKLASPRFSQIVPSTATVRFCVSYWPLDDPRTLKGDLSPYVFGESMRGPPGFSCVITQVP